MKHLVLALCALAFAISLYAIGLSQGASALLVPGAALELLFWVRVTRRKEPKAAVVRAPPNPSIERTHNGSPLQAFISFWALRSLPLCATHVKR